MFVSFLKIQRLSSFVQVARQK